MNTDLNFFNGIPKFLLKFIELDVDQSKHKIETAYIKLWNKSFLSLSIIFFLISLYDIIWIKSVISYCFFLLAVIFCFVLFTDLRFNKLAQIFGCLFLSFVFFYISSRTGFESGVYLFDIPLILAVPNFLNLKKDRQSIILIYFFIFFEFLLDFLTNCFNHPKEKLIFMESLIGSIILIFLVVYFIFKKQLLKIKHYEEKIIMQKEEIEIDIEKLNEVLDLAKKGNNHFFTKFKNLYPYFCERLIEIQPLMSMTELEFCAYIKLNFSTKEIARYTNNSVRSVEGKKYRIRKKYNIPEKIDIYAYMANL